MPKVHAVQSARIDHDDCGVKKGESYYWWEIKTGPASGFKRCSKTYPPQSQLTNSPFYQSVYLVQEDINSVSSVGDSEELQSLVEGWTSDIQSIADECQASYDAMPENFQESSPHQDRIAAMEEWISQIEGTEFGEGMLPEELEGVLDEIKAIEPEIS